MRLLIEFPTCVALITIYNSVKSSGRIINVLTDIHGNKFQSD